MAVRMSALTGVTTSTRLMLLGVHFHVHVERHRIGERLAATCESATASSETTDLARDKCASSVRYAREDDGRSACVRI